MQHPRGSWRRDHQLWLEVFVLFNFAGLALDIVVAHSQNRFRRDAEFIPLYFSIAAAVVLAAVLPLRHRLPAVWRDVGHLIGWLAVGVGLTGVIYHLDSRFFEERTIRSLTYAAPFAAPLAYTGLGLLMLANRLVPSELKEWPQWILRLAFVGFIGNFVFSVTDHAQNGFFNPLEWIPVATSAGAVGFLVVPLAMRVSERYLRLCAIVLLVQAVVGVLGFGLHAAADLRQPGAAVFERIMSGPPPFAPLLFPNLVVLGVVGLWVLAPHLRHNGDNVHGRGRDSREQ